MGDGDAIVEYEAFAFPLAVGGGNFCEVFEDAALEVINVLKALGEEVGGGFFAADATRAEESNLLVLVRI